MASIGDVILRVIADLKGFTTQVVKEAGLAGDKAGKALGSRISKATTIAGSARGGILQGLGLGAGIGIVGLASTAVSKLTDVIGDSINAAKEDQVSQQKLGTTLQANIPHWNGNTAAIEKAIAANTKFGFSDDELRDSLGAAVVATNDVAKAFELQAAAMDLARLKRISLADATTALTKVEGGQFRLLKGMGIELKKNATAEDALAAVKQAARNQAADYLQTDAGKELAAQVKLNESLENLGYKILPLVTDATIAVSDALSGLIDHLTEAGGAGDILGDIFGRDASKVEDPLTAIGKLDRAVTDFLADFVDFATPWDDYVSATDERKAAFDSTTEGLLRTNLATKTAAEGAAGLGAAAEAGYGALGDAATDGANSAADAAHRVITLNKEETRSFADMVKDMEDEASDLIDQVYDPQIQAAELAADKVEAAELRKVIASKSATAAEKRDAADRLISLSKSADETRLALLESGNLTASDTKKWLDKLQKKYDSSTGSAKTRIGELIAKIEALAALSAPGIKIGVTASFGAAPITNNKPRARGGPVMAGRPYLVNEDTRNSEIFVPSKSGGITTQAQAAQAVAAYVAPGTQQDARDMPAAVGDQHFHLNVHGDVRARDSGEVLSQMQRLRSTGNRGFNGVKG